MQESLSTQQTLDPVLSEVNPYDWDEEDMEEVQRNWDSELSDQSSDEETSPQPKRARLGTDVIETASDGTVWRQEQVGAPLHVTPIEAYVADGEPAAKTRNISTRLESFLSFISLDMLHSIQECTIQRAQLTDHDDWYTDIPELMAFIAVVILRGVIKLPTLDDYWSENLGHPLIIGIMSHQRFQDIMEHLRFDNRSTRMERVKTDSFAAISPVWGSFVTNCITSYSPGRHITVDEQLFPTKLCCSFLLYIPISEKFGIKFSVACDSKSKYICNVLPFLGKDPSQPIGEDVVVKLMEPFLDEGRNVTTGNYFTSLSLAQRLLSRKTTVLGAVDKIRREIPQSAKETNRNKYSTQVFSTYGATLTVYARSRETTVHILSSMHGVVQTEDAPKKKPNTVTLHNTTKCVVDEMDQMLREYSVSTATRRWPVAVFYNMIDMAAHNANVLYQACTGRQERRVDFLVELAKELANRHVGEKQARREEVLREQPSTPGPEKRARSSMEARTTVPLCDELNDTDTHVAVAVPEISDC